MRPRSSLCAWEHFDLGSPTALWLTVSGVQVRLKDFAIFHRLLSWVRWHEGTHCGSQPSDPPS